MLQNRKKDAYPILDGKALIKVSLKGKQEEKLWYEDFLSQLRFHLVKNQTKAYFSLENDSNFAVVNLNNVDEKYRVPTSDLELNLAKDEIPFFGKFKLAFGGAVTAGLILLSSWGFAKSTGADISTGSQIPGISVSQNYSNDLTREKSAVVMAETRNESLLLASLVSPDNNSHPFQKIGHTNISPTSHGNIAEGINHTNSDSYTDIMPHSNLDAYTDFTPHSNIFPATHSNVLHTNGGHTNQYSNAP